MSNSTNLASWIEAMKAPGKKKSMPILSFPSITLMGITVKELISNSEYQAKGMKAIADRCPTAASLGMMDLSVEAEAFGSTIKVSDDEVPTVVGKIVETEADIDALKIPKPTSGRTGLYHKAIEKALSLINDRPVLAGGIGPFTLSGRLMDMTDIMVNCLEEPEMTHKLLKKVTEFIISYISEYKKIGAHGVVMAEPAAGMLSPDTCHEFSSTYVKQIRDAVRDNSFIFIYHNCGNATIQLCDSLMSIQADGYHFGDKINIATMLEKAPSDRLIMGNISPSERFRLGTPEEMRQAVFALLKQCAKKHPNFAISSGCDIPPLSPWENIDAYFEAIDEFYR